MTSFDDPVRAEVGAQTVALLAATARLDPAAVRAPSQLPGWSRGHLLAHVANHSQALAGVLAGAADGEVRSMYPSQAERNAAIDAAAGASVEEHLVALVEGANALFAAWRDLPEDRLDVEFTAPAGWVRPVRICMWFRWREVALHLVDLGVGVQGLAHAGPLAARLLDETVAMFSSREGVPGLALSATDADRSWTVGDGTTVVRGGTAALAAWLTGRSDGADLDPGDSLPILPAWA